MTAELVVDVATPADVPGIAAVLRGVADEGRWIGTPPGTSLAALEERFRDRVTDPDAEILVLRAADEVVGLATLLRETPTGAHGLGISISAACRGRGGGGLLVDALLARAAGRTDLHKVELQVWPHNAAAIGLYVSRGFVVEGVLRDHWRRPNGELWSAVVMGWWPPTRG